LGRDVLGPYDDPNTTDPVFDFLRNNQVRRAGAHSSQFSGIGENISKAQRWMGVIGVEVAGGVKIDVGVNDNSTIRDVLWKLFEACCNKGLIGLKTGGRMLPLDARIDEVDNDDISLQYPCERVLSDVKRVNPDVKDYVVSEGVVNPGRLMIRLCVEGEAVLGKCEKWNWLLSVDLTRYGGSELPGWTFRGCRWLKSVIGSPRIREIGELCFAGYVALSVCELAGVEEIDNFAFSDFQDSSQVPLPEFVFSRRLRRIGRGAFGITKLCAIDLRETELTTIGGSAFGRCPELRNVRIGANVAVGEYAFGGSDRIILFGIGDSTTLDETAFLGTWSNPNRSIFDFRLRGMATNADEALRGGLAPGGLVRGEGVALAHSTSPLVACVG
jgi:hypothetical protein